MSIRNTNYFSILSLLLCSLFILSTTNAAFAEAKKAEESPTNSEQVVAEVNTVKLTGEQLEMELKRVLGFKLESLDAARLHVYRKQVLNRMIERELLRQAAVTAKTLPADKAVQEIISEVKKRAGSDEAYLEFLKSQNLSEESFREGITSDLGITNYLGTTVMEGVNVSNEQARAAFDKSPAEFTAPAEVRARHILFKVPQNAEKKVEEEAKARAEKVLAEVKQEDSDFAALAKKHSEGPTKAKGGDLGFFTENQMVAPFSKAAFALEPGNISDLVKTRFGYHIIQMEEKRGGSAPKFEEVKEQVRNKLIHEARQKKIQEHITELKQKAKVIAYIN